MFEKSKELYIAYDSIYRNAKEVSEFFFKVVLICLFLAFGFMGNIEFNPNASIKVAIMECVIVFIISGISLHYANYYQDMSNKYKELATNEYSNLLHM